MSNLESKATKVTIVIRKNIAIDTDLLNSFALEYFDRYAWICHEKDISPKDMVVEGIHYHLVGNLKERTRLGTILNRLVKHMGFKDPFGIEIQCAGSIEGCYQYLIHKNDLDKTPHDIKEITSNIPAEELKTLMDMSFTDTTITQDRIDVLVNDNVRYVPASKTLPAYISINYKEIARGIGATRCNCVSWSLNNTIKQRVIELCRLHRIPVPELY